MTKEQEILDKISELKAALLQDRPNEKDKAKSQLSELKEHLVNQPPKLVTDSSLRSVLQEVLADAFSKIKEIHTEVTKHKKTEMLEMLGLGSIAAVHEKYQESKLDPQVAWKDWLYAAIGGAFLLVVLPALAFFFRSKIVDLFRRAQARGDENRPVWTGNGNGGFHRERLRDVNDREQRVWNGGTSLADLVGNPTNVEQTRKLREQLEKLNPELLKFNQQAPSFLQSFGKLPKESKATKAANALRTMAGAIKEVNARKLVKIAEGLERLNLALDEFQPTKLPKEADIAGTASAMNNLANETQTLREKFNGLRSTISSLDQVIAGAAN
ncbi:hypothetical protein [Streptomyces sp. NPDC006477]|uniref:hypothetical protein n=1 Tax=Streptomyces sp. NPDC006477 TaxID=3364747 RepID=UPI003695A4A3